MANEAHLKILRQDVNAWNAWRRNYGGIRPDLSGADLSGADLSLADLSAADLTGTKLSGTRLTDANLRDADLTGATITKTELGAGRTGKTSSNPETWADLRGAVLAARTERVTLDCVRLDGAHLGKLERAVKLKIRRASWTRVHVGARADYDPGHDPRDTSYWLLRQGEESLQEALLRWAIEQATGDVTIVFSRPVWRELHVVEMGLREVLGREQFSVFKDDDRLGVRFASQDERHRGLEAVFVQLAAMETVDPQGVESVTLHASRGEILFLDTIALSLTKMATRLERITEMLERGLLDETKLAGARPENPIDAIPGLDFFSPAMAALYRDSREHFEFLRRQRGRKKS